MGKWPLTLALCGGYFLVLLDVTVVNVALPSIGFAGIALSIGGPLYPVPIAALAVWGAGLGVLTPAIVVAAMRTVPDTPGIASGASNTARQTGGALGVTLFGAIARAAAGPGFTGHAIWLFTVGAVAFAGAAVFSAVSGLESAATPTSARR